MHLIRIIISMKLKKGDKIKVLAGKDRGKTGVILQVFKKENRASVEGINLLVKNIKPQKRGEKGQRIKFPSPLNISNLALMCPKCGQSAKVGYKFLENKKKARVCKKCKEVVN